MITFLINFLIGKDSILKESDMVYIEDCHEGDVGKIWLIGYRYFVFKSGKWVLLPR